MRPLPAQPKSGTTAPKYSPVSQKADSHGNTSGPGSEKKSGWLQKYSGKVFKSWKRRYCVLGNGGEFSIYEGQQKSSPDTVIQVKSDCKEIAVGYSCGGIDLPKGQGDVNVLFSIKTEQEKKYYFAAATESECKEWTRLLEQASNVKITHSKNPYPTSQGAPKSTAASPQLHQPRQPAYPQQQQQLKPSNAQSAPSYTPPASRQGQPGQRIARPPGSNMQAPRHSQPRYGQPAPRHGQPRAAASGSSRFAHPAAMGTSTHFQGQQQKSSNNSKDMMLGAAAGFAFASQMNGGLGQMAFGNHGFGHPGFGHHGAFGHGDCDSDFGHHGFGHHGSFGHEGLGDCDGGFGHHGFGHHGSFGHEGPDDCDGGFGHHGFGHHETFVHEGPEYVHPEF